MRLTSVENDERSFFILQAVLTLHRLRMDNLVIALYLVQAYKEWFDLNTNHTEYEHNKKEAFWPLVSGAAIAATAAFQEEQPTFADLNEEAELEIVRVAERLNEDVLKVLKRIKPPVALQCGVMSPEYYFVSF